MSSSLIAGSVATTINANHDVHYTLGQNIITNEQQRTNRFLSTPEIIHRPTTMYPAQTTEVCPQPWIEDRKIYLNIRGTLYVTYESTLAKYPHTLLGCSHKRNHYYNHEKHQYYFERNREAFNAILYYYQSSGKLIRPSDVDEETFLDDLEFFEIDPWNVAELEYGSENFKRPEKKEPRPHYLEDSESVKEQSLGSSWDVLSRRSKRKFSSCDVVLSWPCAVVVIVFAFTTCLSSLSDYQSMLTTSCRNDGSSNTPRLDNTDDNPLVIIHFVCTIWFLFELILRFILSFSKLRLYLGTLMGVIDIISAVSTLLQITLRQVNICQHSALTWLVNLLRSCSLLCMFKLSRYSTGLQLFGRTLKACSGQLILSFYCVGISLLFFSAVIYHSETSVNQGFASILDAFWYTIVTLTTVGYGDLVPMTIVGKVFGAACAVFGVIIVVAWPATIFVSPFTEIYNHEIGRNKTKTKKVWSRGFNKFLKGVSRLDKRGCNFR